MKQRVQMDTFLMLSAALITVFLFLIPNIYSENNCFIKILAYFGFIGIFKGVYLRMSARGHKRAHSQRSESLVMTGPYSFTRNPMYLGSFLIGLGFVLVLWPWWAVPIFILIFFARFKRQITIEEKYLSEHFGKQYQTYCLSTPRFYPSLKSVIKLDVKDAFNIQEAFSTKDKWGLVSWPVFALILAYIQQWIVYPEPQGMFLIFVFALAVATFFVGMFVRYGIK